MGSVTVGAAARGSVIREYISMYISNISYICIGPILWEYFVYIKFESVRETQRRAASTNKNVLLTPLLDPVEGDVVVDSNDDRTAALPVPSSRDNFGCSAICNNCIGYRLAFHIFQHIFIRCGGADAGADAAGAHVFCWHLFPCFPGVASHALQQCVPLGKPVTRNPHRLGHQDK